MTLFWIVQTFVAISTAVSSIVLNRRPDVFYKGRTVDREASVSFLSRYTWAWVQPLIRHASVHQDIASDDVPQPASHLRSKDLKTKWDIVCSNASLFCSLLGAYKKNLALLWTSTLLRCIISILPFWAMSKILVMLQDTTKSSHPVDVFTFVVVLAASSLLDSVSVFYKSVYMSKLIELLVDGRLALLVLPFEASLANSKSCLKPHF